MTMWITKAGTTTMKISDPRASDATPTRPQERTDPLAERLDRIERKLDTLIEAMAEEADEQEEAVEVVTMGGQRYRVPVNPAGFL